MKIRFVEETIHGGTHYFTEQFQGNETMGVWSFVPDSLNFDKEIAHGYFEEIKATGEVSHRKILEEATTSDPTYET